MLLINLCAVALSFPQGIFSNFPCCIPRMYLTLFWYVSVLKHSLMGYLIIIPAAFISLVRIIIFTIVYGQHLSCGDFSIQTFQDPLSKTKWFLEIGLSGCVSVCMQMIKITQLMDSRIELEIETQNYFEARMRLVIIVYRVVSKFCKKKKTDPLEGFFFVISRKQL